MRIWFKIIKDTHLLRDFTYESYEEDTRTHKIFHGLEAACVEFDLSQPIWLDINQSDFKKFAKTRFTQDSFIHPIGFDYLEIQVLDEDY